MPGFLTGYNGAFVRARTFTSKCSPVWSVCGHGVLGRFDASCRHIQSLKKYSSLTARSHAVETVEVEYGSKGPITLNVFHPLSGSWFESAILYLPAGPVLEGTAKPAFDDAIISALSASSNSTIVRVNYRAGQLAPFPTAIHDVLAGYDWLANYLADEDETDGRSTERRIGVCGQLLGGGLASSLALTECRLGQPSIVAAAVNNPITDWVLPDREQLEAELSDSDSEIQEEVGDRESDIALGRKKKRSKTKTPAESSWQQFQHSDILSASAFKKARNDIFTSENAYFDNFASPIHWFRTPGIEVAENLKNLSIDDEDPPIPQLLRKYRLNFPPTGSGLELPHVRMSTGEESILKTSNEEFLSRLNMAEVTTYLRARKIKYAKYSSLVQDDKEEVDFICDIADKKFPINTLPGVGIWGLGREEIWRPDIEGAGRWLRNLMLPP